MVLDGRHSYAAVVIKSGKEVLQLLQIESLGAREEARLDRSEMSYRLIYSQLSLLRAAAAAAG